MTAWKLVPCEPTEEKYMSAPCDDCPPVGYPTDKTRCAECPRRTTLAPAAEGK